MLSYANMALKLGDAATSEAMVAELLDEADGDVRVESFGRIARSRKIEVHGKLISRRPALCGSGRRVVARLEGDH